jgi:cation diffusion facilitator CzcD-associated flavoprotein CzcO
VETSHGTWAVQAVINATGTWSAPNVPWYPGIDTFTGRQLHVAQYVSAAQFAGLHVIVAGGGISAVQLLGPPVPCEDDHRLEGRCLD